jgi:hypothetical protein
MSQPTDPEQAVPVTPENLAEMGLVPTERDYTREQNDRVIPLVRFLFKSIGNHDFKLQEDADDKTQEQAEIKAYNVLYTDHLMPEVLARGNLRLADINHLFALSKLAVEMLKSIGTSAENQLRPIGAAQEVLALLAEEENLMLNPDGQEPKEFGERRAEQYGKFYKEKVVPVFEKHNLRYDEVEQVYALMMALVSQMEYVTTQSLRRAKAIADTKLWEVTDTDEITVNDVHAVLTEAAKE